MLVVGLAAFAPSAAQAAGPCGEHPWCNRSLGPDHRAGLVLAAMTLDEKISLLAGDNGTGFLGGENAHTGTSDGVPRLGIPTVNYSDGPQGARQGPVTALPSPEALAAAWDPALAQRYGSVVGNEVRLKGNDAVFGPTLDIVRTPLAGRTYEDYGEDPFLTAQTAVGWVDGAQSQGVMATVKHLALNNQEGYSPAAQTSVPGQLLGPAPTEGNRMLVDARVDERTLHEIYLPAFEAAVRRAHAALVMCAYNRVNGVYACQNRQLLTDVLRREWGFRGYVVADYGAAHDPARSLAAGLDFVPWPPAGAYSPGPVNLALTSRQATVGQVDRQVGRILRTMFAFGLFDRQPYKNVDRQIAYAAHARVAQRVEESAITLLRNRDEILPLRQRGLQQVAIIGANASRFVTGGGSGNVSPYSFVSPVAALIQRLGHGAKITYDDGTDQAKAVRDARAASITIVFAGDYDAEGTDRLCLTLECPPFEGGQDSLIRAVAAAQRRTVVVLQTGGPVLTPWRARVAAILEAWYPGGQAGPAITRVLMGDVDPSGRLPTTFPASASQLPTAGDARRYPGVNERVTYQEGLLVGYRWYDARRLVPAFPFGYGLSYTSFSLGRPRIRAVGPSRFAVSVPVRNVGHRSGAEVVQLYVGDPRANREPPRQLKAFTKVFLRPGRRHLVTLRLDRTSFEVFNPNRSAFVAPSGTYRIYVGTSSRDLPLEASVTIR